MRDNQKFLIMLCVFVLIFAVLALVRKNETSRDIDNSAGSQEIYYCPMHPSYTSPKPGNCPICNMRLVKRINTSGQSGEKSPDEKWSSICILHNCHESHNGQPCPMMAVVKQGERVSCPICGEHIYGGFDSQSAGMPTGHARIVIDLQKQKMLGMTSAVVQKKNLQKVIRAPGNVANSHGWIEAFVFEEDLPFLLRSNVFYLGQGLDAESSAYPGIRFHGTVQALDLKVDPITHTVRLRGQIHDPRWKLFPGMYLTIEIIKDLGEEVVIPVSAVFDTGDEKIIFIDHGEGSIEPRKVTLGIKGKEEYQVIAGVDPGEVVITSSNFLIDSESRLRAALTGIVNISNDTAKENSQGGSL